MGADRRDTRVPFHLYTNARIRGDGCGFFAVGGIGDRGVAKRIVAIWRVINPDGGAEAAKVLTDKRIRRAADCAASHRGSILRPWT